MSAEVSCITLLWHFEFASPIAMHSGGSDLNTSSLRSGDKERAQPGCCQKPQKVHRISPLKYWCVHVRLCLKSRRWHLHLLEWRCTCMHASKSAPGCVHLCMWNVFAKGEGFSAFNYSSANTLHVHFRGSQPTDPDTLLRSSSWRKPERKHDTRTSWAGPLINSSSNIFLAANYVFPLM